MPARQLARQPRSQGDVTSETAPEPSWPPRVRRQAPIHRENAPVALTTARWAQSPGRIHATRQGRSASRQGRPPQPAEPGANQCTGQPQPRPMEWAVAHPPGRCCDGPSDQIEAPCAKPRSLHAQRYEPLVPGDPDHADGNQGGPGGAGVAPIDRGPAAPEGFCAAVQWGENRGAWRTNGRLLSGRPAPGLRGPRTECRRPTEATPSDTMPT